jgi:hypothetical protein
MGMRGKGSVAREVRRVRPPTHKQQMALQFGYAAEWADAFRSQEEFRDCWQRHREQLMAGYPAGRRPLAYWALEAGDLEWPGHDYERSALWEAGRLNDDERGELERTWRQEFERARSPDFWLSVGGQILKGEAARRAHYEWADIPAELIERWSAEPLEPAAAITESDTVASLPSFPPEPPV